MHPLLLIVLLSSAAVLLQRVLGSLLREKLATKMTGVSNLKGLGKVRPDSQKIQGTAVVCGGSVAGLYSARVCSDHFEDVVIIEPEAWLSTEEGTVDRIREKSTQNTKPNIRSRVMQYPAFHLFQTFTFQAWRRWFPQDADAELAKIEGFTAPADFSPHVSGARLGAPTHLGEIATTTFITRSALETTLRRLIRRTCPNVRFVVGTVTAVTPSFTDRSVIKSVSYRPAESNNPIEMEATLVLDCTGAAQAGLKMLERAGYGMAPRAPSISDLKTSYNPAMRYTTAEYPVDPAFLEKILPDHSKKLGGLFIFIPNPAMESRIFGITRVEHNHLSMVIGGYDYKLKPKNIADVRNHGQSINAAKPLPSWIFELLDHLEENGAEDKATYVDNPVPALTFIPYENAKDLPSNFVALGDSTMRLNPAGGQGCTKAAVSATVLNTVLHTVPSSSTTIPDSFGPTYFKEVAPKINYLWNSTRLRDYGFSTTKPSANETNETGAVNRWYMSNLLPVALKDPDVAATFWTVGQFIAPPTDMFAPSIVFKVLRQAVSRYL